MKRKWRGRWNGLRRMGCIEALESRRLLAAGDLDTSFGGGDGTILIDFTGPGTGNDTDGVMAVQGDGKIIIAGSTYSGSNRSQVALARLHPEGTLDTSFGVGGKTVHPILSGSVMIRAIVLQEDGKIVVGGSYAPPGLLTTDFLIARFNSNGTIDTTFAGGDGVFTLDAGFNFSDSVHALAMQSDGKIVAAGLGTQTTSNLATLRLTTGGALDTAFDGDGIALVDYYGGADWANDVIVDPDGKIVVAGGAFFPGFYRDLVLLRYDTNGTLDSSFGGDGKVDTDFGRAAMAQAILRQPDGKYVVGGVSGTDFNRQNYVVARYNSTGSLDTSFGTSAFPPGTTEVPALLGHVQGSYGIARQADGKILFGGSVDGHATLDNHMGVLRVDSAGVPDTTFGSGGYRLYDMPGVTAGLTIGADITLTDDEKILVSGYTFGEVIDLAVARVHSQTVAGGGSVALVGTTLTIIGTESSDQLSLLKSGSNFVATLNSIPYVFPAASVLSINVNLLDGDDTQIHDGGVPGGTSHLGDGNDSFISNTGNLAQTLNLFGNDGNDTVMLGVASFTTIVFDGGAGNDKLTYNGSQGNDSPLNVSVNQVDDEGFFPAIFSQTEQLEVKANFGFDTINLKGTLATMQVVIDAGDGNDTINVRNDANPDSFQGFPTLVGGSGTDTIVFDDHANTFGDTYTISGGSFARNFLGTFTLHVPEEVQVIGSSGSSQFNVTPSSITRITVNGALPTTLPGDAINVALTGATGASFFVDGPTAGHYTFANRQPVYYTGMERNLTPDITPPTVDGGTFLFETAHAIRVQFSENVSASVQLLDLHLNRPGFVELYYPTSFTILSSAGQPTLVQWNFNYVLPDGNYKAVLPSGVVQDAAGNQMTAAYSFPLFALAGDANRDRKVDLYDLVTLASNWQGTGKTFSQGDFDYNGIVDATDLGMLATRWQQKLDNPATSLPVPTTARRAPVRTPTRIASDILQD